MGAAWPAVGDGAAGHQKSCGVPERSGTHSDVRLAVVPLSGDVTGGCVPPSMEIHARNSKNVRLQSNPDLGVNPMVLVLRLVLAGGPGGEAIEQHRGGFADGSKLLERHAHLHQLDISRFAC